MVLLLLQFCQGGCRIHNEIRRRSIDDLFMEAQQNAAARPNVILPTADIRLTTVDEEELLSSPHHARLSDIDEQEVGSNEKITESFEQSDVRDALQILADYGKHTIIIDETVGGVTSAQIKDESFESALEKILMPLGLVYVKYNGKYLVAPPDPDSPLFTYVAERTRYSPKYHNIDSLVELLPPRFKQYVQISKERNIAIVDAPKVIAAEITQRLTEIDRPIPQVELEAIVCVVSPDKGFRFGLDWGHVVGISGVDSLKAGMTGLTFSGQVSPNGASNAFSDFAITSAFVRLLAQEGYVTIRAAPRVTARDGEKAKISIQREAFFSLQPSNSNVLFRQDVQKVESGISLEIIPRVHGDIVNVLIEKAEVSEDLRTSDSRSELTSNPYPIISRRQVSTEVNVRNGNTIVIGGLVQTQTVDRVNRIPYLSRIPLAGNLFKTIEKQEQDAEVAIFISPRIVPAEMCTIP
jgi:type IV pilus assembly protein PilQ